MRRRKRKRLGVRRRRSLRMAVMEMWTGMGGRRRKEVVRGVDGDGRRVGQVVYQIRRLITTQSL